MIRSFDVIITIYGELKLDQSVIDEVELDNWRDHFYNLRTADEVAAHIAWGLSQGWSLNQLDGWAHIDNSLAKFLKDAWYVEVVDMGEITTDESNS